MTDRLNIKPHVFFLFAALILCFVYNKVTPALQVPDEFDHFHRSFRISEGDFLPVKKDNRLGGDIPYSIKEFELPYRTAATTLKYNVPNGTTRNSFSIPYNNDHSVFVDFPNTSYYSPVSYIPQSISIFVLKHFNCSVGALYYGTRVFTFLVWLFCMFIFIRQVPIYKWFFVLICLLPMHVYIANSFSADTVSNILSFLFLGAVLKYAFDEKEMTWKRILYLFIIACLLALAKLVYVGVALSIFIIPAAKFGNKKKFFAISGVIIAVSFFLALYWSSFIMKNYYMTHADYNEAYRNYLPLVDCANYYRQKEYILSHGFYFFKVLFHTLFDHPYTYLNSYVGNFGNYDIPLPRWATVFAWLMILFVILFEKVPKKLSLLQKIILFAAAFASFAALALSQHLTWDCVGEGAVDFLHGRYLIAIFPLALLFLSGYFPRLKINPAIFVVIFCIIINWAGANEVNSRYHKEWYASETHFSCGGEEIKNGRLATSTESITMEGMYSKNDSVAKTGGSSLLLSPASPYCFTYDVPNMAYGDRVEVFAWQKGAGSQFIMTFKGKNCEEYYLPVVTQIYGDTAQWNRVHAIFTMEKKCDSAKVRFFMWNPTNSKVYVDDLEFSHKKFDKDYLGESLKRLSLFE
ncbi:MAG: Protein of unknown function rane [Bacteroidetes bacterium]|jgi:uncharacterized membrane protein|nr:Protein of unknown function rane [Bacteroidota bacterium]